jgi:hypothetical protein
MPIATVGSRDWTAAIELPVDDGEDQHERPPQDDRCFQQAAPASCLPFRDDLHEKADSYEGATTSNPTTPIASRWRRRVPGTSAPGVARTRAKKRIPSTAGTTQAGPIVSLSGRAK